MKQNVTLAIASLTGGNGYPGIRGTAIFRQTEIGVMLTVNVSGLPTGNALPTNSSDRATYPNCHGRFFALHIHDGVSCNGTSEDEFSDAGVHYNPYNCPHPQHAGDLPSLIGCQGKAYCSILTDRFSVNEVLGKTIIIHEQPDDFMTQPSGNAGKKIACGIIQEY